MASADMSFEYHYTHGEANFGPPLETEVAGGAHLTFDVICRVGEELVAFRRPEGLHDAAKNALYFPHGLIRFGESVEDCVQRLVDEQGGEAQVQEITLYSLPTWVDDNKHWHMCLNVVARLDSVPNKHSDGVSEIVSVKRGHPGADFGWWTDDQLEALFDFVQRG